MTTRHHSIQVVLEQDISYDSVMAEARARTEMRRRLVALLESLRDET